MAMRDKWCQLRMSAEELAFLDALKDRMGAENRADLIRDLVKAQHIRMDKADSRRTGAEKNPD